MFAGFQIEPDARELGHEALEAALATNDAYAEGLSEMALGYIEWTLSDFDAAKVHMLRMLDAGQRANDDWMIANANLLAGFSDRMMSRLDEAAALTAAAEAAYRRIGQPSGLGWVLSAGGQVARYRGDFETEVLKQREARTVFERQGAPFQISFTLMNEAIALALLRRPEEAIVPSRQAIAIERELTMNFQTVEALSLAAWFEHDAGNLAEARNLHEEAMQGSAPRYDKHQIEMLSYHLMDFMAILERWEDAARFDGFHLANLSRPEPAIYSDHFEPHRVAYSTALGDRETGLIDEGRAMSGEDLHAYALRVLTEVKFDLEG
jgi:tetratricopeptide (TPR) repeat protein